MIVGVDIGGTKIHVVALDAGLALLAQSTTPTPKGGDGVVAAVEEEISRLSALLPGERVESIGIGIPGSVDVAAGVVSNAVNLGIDRLDLGDEVQRHFGTTVRVDNDVKATALGAARWWGEKTDLVYINVGTGVSAAFVCGGRIVRGPDNMAGEIGHIPIDPRGEPCACGQRGCLETLIGGAWVRRRIEKILPGRSSVSDLFAEDAIDRPGASEMRRVLLDGLLLAVEIATLCYGPAQVIIGGGVIRRIPNVQNRLATRAAERGARSDFLRRLDLGSRVAILPPGFSAAAIGAALVGRTAGS